MATKRLYRSNEDKLLFGVCGGIADYFGVDVTWIRLAFVAATLIGGPGILLYLIGGIVIPRRRAIAGNDFEAFPSTALRRY
jgi:phage shock protein PspC (stress-responsive transcriptional regulator)